MMPSRRGLSRRSVASRPGVSRNSSCAGVVFFGLKCVDSQSRRGSAIAGLPTWPCWLRDASGATPVSQWKTVLLPDPEKPAMPTRMGVGLCAKVHLSLATLYGRRLAVAIFREARPAGSRREELSHPRRDDVGAIPHHPVFSAG